jgi:quercetin dioxygenase-like cupin family protein
MLKTAVKISLMLWPALVCAQLPVPQPILPDAVKWQASPAAPGAESAWFVGAADQAGPYAQRVRLAKGSVIAPHTHIDQRMSVVLSGTLYVGFGDKVDEKTAVAVPAGAVYVAPAGTAHYAWAKDGAVEYQETGVGPTGTTFLPAAK